jgi:plastocyanin
MAFNWVITISPNAAPSGPAQFAPPSLGAAPGDQIVWSNGDHKAHWPGLLSNGTVNATFFMPNQIAPNSTSSTFSPTVAGSYAYVCSVPGHQHEHGTIVVQAAP